MRSASVGLLVVVAVLAGVGAVAAEGLPEVAISQPWKFRLANNKQMKGHFGELVADGDVLVATKYASGAPGARNSTPPRVLLEAKQCGSDSAGWQPIEPAPPGWVEGLIATEKGPLVFTDTGMYRLNRVDRTWTKVGAGIGKLDAPRIRTGGTSLFAVSGKKVYRSVDAGDHWKLVGKLPKTRDSILLAARSDTAYFFGLVSDANPKAEVLKMSMNGKLASILKKDLGQYQQVAYALDRYLVMGTEHSNDGGKLWHPTNTRFEGGAVWTGDRAIAGVYQGKLATLSSGHGWFPLARDGLDIDGVAGNPITEINTVTTCGSDAILMDRNSYGVFALPLSALPAVTK